jgi:hypothetical protein
VTVKLEKQKQTERGKQAGGNVLKADSKKTVKVSEEKRGDLGDV